ncbi:MAG: hypothetical protein ACE5IJ_01940 [Thermoplasmata archaeon]
MTRHKLKMTRFRLVSILSWIMAIFFLFWPFFTPTDLRSFFFLTFLFVGIAVAMEWFDARVIAIKILRAARGARNSETDAR